MVIIISDPVHGLVGNEIKKAFRIIQILPGIFGQFFKFRVGQGDESVVFQDGHGRAGVVKNRLVPALIFTGPFLGFFNAFTEQDADESHQKKDQDPHDIIDVPRVTPKKVVAQQEDRGEQQDHGDPLFLPPDAGQNDGQVIKMSENRARPQHPVIVKGQVGGHAHQNGHDQVLVCFRQFK